MESEILIKFKKILSMSQKVKISQVARSLELTSDQLFEDLIRWSEFLPFKINGEFIIVDNLDNFIEKIDEEFAKWEQGMGSKEDKIEPVLNEKALVRCRKIQPIPHINHHLEKFFNQTFVNYKNEFIKIDYEQIDITFKVEIVINFSVPPWFIQNYQYKWIRSNLLRRIYNSDPYTNSINIQDYFEFLKKDSDLKLDISEDFYEKLASVLKLKNQILFIKSHFTEKHKIPISPQEFEIHSSYVFGHIVFNIPVIFKNGSQKVMIISEEKVLNTDFNALKYGFCDDCGNVFLVKNLHNCPICQNLICISCSTINKQRFKKSYYCATCTSEGYPNE